MKLSITVPKPPSVNTLYANGRKGRHRTKRYDEWLARAGFALNQQLGGWQALTGPVVAELTCNKGRGDLPNFDKAVFDLFTKHGVFEDDSQIVEFTMRHDPQCGDLMFIEVESA